MRAVDRSLSPHLGSSLESLIFEVDADEIYAETVVEVSVSNKSTGKRVVVRFVHPQNYTDEEVELPIF